MQNYKYIYGPVPSRRLGISLGISPIPKKTCNYSCVYCQLGATNNLTNTRQDFYDYSDIIREFKDYLDNNKAYFDVVTIVGEGEPTLYKSLGNLIDGIRQINTKPIVVITNGALLYDNSVKKDLNKADIIIPSIDSCNSVMFKKINRPHKSLNYNVILDGIISFSKQFSGQIWLEIMLISQVNDDLEHLNCYKDMLKDITHDRLYLNTPIRPPAVSNVKEVSNYTMNKAQEILNGVSINTLISSGFYSKVKDNYQAILSIIKRHPMNQYEIKAFLSTRDCKDINKIIDRMNNDENISKIDYKGYITYRLV